MNDPLPVGVIGCGRMGKLHARVYSQMPQVKLVGVHDIDAAASEATATAHGGQAFASLDELLGQVRAVTIAVPTQFHLAAAQACLGRRIACLIEKPLARNAAECRQIADLARAAGVPVQVGHIERFNPAVRAMHSLKIEPRFIEVSRISPMTFRSLDVGVVLDMMIHDIDIVLKLAGAAVSRVDAVGVSVIGGVEDICNARVTFANGCAANLTASRLAMKTERRLRVYSRDAFVSLDYQKRQAVVVRRGGNLDAIRETVARIRRGEVKDLSQLDYAGMVGIERLPIDEVEPLRAQAESFIATVRDGNPPEVSVNDGLAAVELAERIVEAIKPGMEL